MFWNPYFALFDTFSVRKFCHNNTYKDRAIAQAVSCWLPTAAEVGFVVDKIALG
jgi:hypothetical protein